MKNKYYTFKEEAPKRMLTWSFTIDLSSYIKLKQAAQSASLSTSEYLRKMINDYIKN